MRFGPDYWTIHLTFPREMGSKEKRAWNQELLCHVKRNQFRTKAQCETAIANLPPNLTAMASPTEAFDLIF